MVAVARGVGAGGVFRVSRHEGLFFGASGRVRLPVS